MASQRDLAIAQFIGFHHGRDNQIIPLVDCMGLKKSEWLKIREKESFLFTENEKKEIDEYFKI